MLEMGFGVVPTGAYFGSRSLLDEHLRVGSKRALGTVKDNITSTNCKYPAFVLQFFLFRRILYLQEPWPR